MNNNAFYYSSDLAEYFNHKSMMEVLGFDRDECVHSKFLAWLFENPNTRSVTVTHLLLLLKFKKEQDQKNTHFPKHLIKLLNKDSFQIYDVKVTLEDIVECNDTCGRADIVTEVVYNKDKHLYIIIENKIDSLEHRMGKGQKPEWQTVGYYNYYKNKYQNEKCLFVYLTRPEIQIDKNKLQEPYIRKDGGPQSEHFTWINYQDILDKVLVPLKDNLPVGSEEWMRVDDYIRCLGINGSQDNLIAVSKELKAIVDKVWGDEGNKVLFDRLKNKDINLNEFWETNKSLIQPLFKVLKYLYFETKAIEDIDSVVNGKDTTRYTLSFKGQEYTNLSKNGLVKTVVEIYIETDNDLKHVRAAFPPKLRMINKGVGADPSSLSNQVVIQDTNKPNKWSLLDGKSDWYVNQSGWDGKDMMNYFIEHAKKLLPELQINEMVPNQSR